jgi:hypothetical protein
MKQIWPNYSYSPTTNVLTLTGLNIDRDQLLLVSAPERGRIMYNFADSTVTASAFTAGANTGLTLVASTAGLTTTAALVIYYDDQVGGISGTVTANVGNAVVIQVVNAVQDGDGTTFGVDRNFPISGTVTVGNTVNGFFLSASDSDTNLVENIANALVSNSIAGITNALPAGTNQIGTVTANTFAVQGTAVTTSNFTSTTASTVLANYNATREVLTIFNEGAGNLHIAPGATCTTIAYQVRLSAGDYYEVPNHQTTITHSAVFATAGTARVTQVS